MTSPLPDGHSTPLRVLYAAPNPTDARPFDSARVWAELSEGLSAFTDRGLVVIDRLADPTESGLRRALASGAYQALHLVAHAEERRAAHLATIGLQAADGRLRNVTATYLAQLLSGFPSLKVVVLQGADEASRFELVAEELKAKGVATITVPSFSGSSARSAIEKLYASVLGTPGDAPGQDIHIDDSFKGAAIEPGIQAVINVSTAAPREPGPQMPITPVQAPPAPLEVFFSYAHEDEELRQALEKHLALLQRRGLIVGWHDRRIIAGEQWSEEIDVHVHSAQVILLLISSDFLASDYCYGIEMKIALERHDRHEAIVIPVILRPVDWSDASFAHLQALPRDAKPITTWPNRDEAFADVARGIREWLTSRPRAAR
jgi:hypothetical protein